MKSKVWDAQGVAGESGVLGASQDVVVDVPLPLEEHVCLADGVGLIVHLLAVEVGGDYACRFPLLCS